MDDKQLDMALRDACAAPELPEGFDAAWRSAVKREELRMMNEKKNKPKIWKILVPVAAALVLVLGSLSVANFMPGQVNTVKDGTAVQSYATARRSAAPVAGTGYDSGADYATEMLYAEDVEESVAADMPAVGLSGTSTNGDGSTLWRSPTDGKKIIRTASMTLRTQEFDKSLEALKALIAELGGYLEYHYQFGDGTGSSLRYASMTVRIPQDRLDAFLTRSGSIGRITEQNQSAVDASTEYSDNETRLKTLRAKLERLTQLMSQAEDTEDLITLENAISETQYSIDRYETAQRQIDSSVNMSSVSLTLEEEKEKEIAQTKEITFGERISAAFAAGFKAVAMFGQNMLVFLTMAFPFLLGIAVITLVVVLIVRRKRATRKQNKD